MEIKVDDLSGQQVIGLIAEHLQGMAADSPPESIHALDLDGLKKPEITFWCAWEAEELLGLRCHARIELGACRTEIDAYSIGSPEKRRGETNSCPYDRGCQESGLYTNQSGDGFDGFVYPGAEAV